MLRNKLKRKHFLFLSTIMSLLAVFVCAIATAAWFQLDSQPLQTSLVSGTGSVSLVDNSTYGYKINPTLGGDGKIDYSNNVVTKKNGSTISTTNLNLEGLDDNFDIPDEGIGYYLIEQNAENTFTYNYNSTKMATKFVSKTGGSVNTHYISSKSLTQNTKYRVKKYTFVNNQTVYEQVQIKTSNNAGSEITLDATGTNATYDVTINTAGTYKIWLNYSSATSKWDLSLEATSFSVAGLNSASSIRDRTTFISPNIKKAGTYVNGNQNNFIHFRVAKSIFNGWDVKPSNYYIHLWDGTGDCNGGWLKDAEKMVITNDSNYYTYTYYYNTRKPTDVIFMVTASWGTKQSNAYSLSSVSAGQTVDITAISGALGNLTVTLRTRDSNNRYNFENYYSTNLNNAFSGTLKYYAFSNNGMYGPDREFDSALDMRYDAGNIYYCQTSSSYDRIIFIGTSVNGPTQTQDITIGSANQYWVPGGISDNKYSGAWRDAHAAGSYTFHLLDFNGSWASYYCYAYGAASTAPTNNAWPGVRMNSTTVNYTDLATNTAASYTYYSISVSSAYTNIIFNNGSGGDGNQLGEYSTSTYNGKYFVMTSSTSGNWYASISAITSSTDSLNTYRVFDKDEVLTSFTYQSTTYSGTPKVHCWFDNDTTNTTSKTFYVNPSTTWPGLTLTSVVGEPHVYSFQAPSTYVNFILNNGKANSSVQGSFQTADLTGDDGLSGHAYTNQSSYYYVLKGNTAEPHTSNNITYFECEGEWVTDLAVIPLKVVYFKRSGGSDTALDTTLCPVIIATNDYTYSDENFTPSITTKAQLLNSSYSTLNVPVTTKADTINGILYTFDFDSTLTWYTDQACTELFTNGDTLDSGSSLYCKAYCDLSTLTTLYVDASHSGTGASNTYWQNISICGQGGSDTPYFSSNDTGATWKIGTHIYRFTVPSTYTIRIANSGYSSSGGNNTSVNFLVSSRTTNFIVINTASSGNNCTVTDCTDLATNIGTARIYISTNNGFSFDTHYDMSIGDQTSNDFVYELGIRIASGSYIYVDVTETDGTHNYYRYTEYVNDKPTYVADAGDGYHNVKLTSFTGHARFNFYITHNATKADRKLSIAMVPDDGNGYYIMPYSSSLGTNTYSGAIKMSSGSETSASYSGYYASAGETIFIRSYINAVDTIYTSYSYLYTDVSMDTNSANATYGVITFTNAGYYDIDVYNGSVSVNRYLIGDFFKVNALDTASSKIDTIDHIKAQITSLVIEVQFTCNNTYASKMSLTADNDLEAFVGAALYCSASPLDNPYSYLRTNCYSDISSTTGVIDDSNSSFVVPANSASTYYAYILVDYIPTDNGGDYDDFLDDYGGNIYFYLHAKQYIA